MGGPGWLAMNHQRLQEILEMYASKLKLDQKDRRFEHDMCVLFQVGPKNQL